MSIGTSSLRIIGIEPSKKHLFNGKEETALKPQRMTPRIWMLQYNRNHQKIKFPTRFCSNMKIILTRKGDFGGVKTHDWHIFIKVIIFLVYILVFTILHVFGLLFCLILKNILMRRVHCYSMFYLYLSQTTLTIMSNRSYMILENT